MKKDLREKIGATQLVIVLVSLLFSSNILASTIDWRSNRLNPLEKITVGPWDNYGAAISPTESTIFYTQDKNQLSGIIQHDLKTQTSTQLASLNGDAKQPAVNNLGNLVAFTYYGNDALGDVCVYPIETQTMDCISSNNGVEQSPFWVSSQKLGFLRRPADSLLWQLVIFDLKDRKEKIIAEGDISAPTSSHDGRYVLYNSKNAVNRAYQYQIHIIDLQKGQEQSLPPINLPGNIGFSAFSQDGNYIYFSHYLNDTNADQVINADDNSVIFRIPFSSWLSASEAVFPEQLTSVDYNCEFPQAGKTYLYLSCAFEGSLDIYRLPLTGMVKKSWGKSQLNEAHLVSRSNEQRLLLLNAMRYRTGLGKLNYLQRAIGNHLQINEITATRFYISELLNNQSSTGEGSGEQVKFYRVLDILLQLRSEKQKYKNNVITLSFLRSVEKTKRALANIHADSLSEKLAKATIEYELGITDRALKILNEIPVISFPLEIQKYLAISLYQPLLAENSSTKLNQLYFALLNDLSSSFEFRLYYANLYLANKTRNNTDSLLQTALVKDKNIQLVFQADELGKQLVSANTEKAKIAIFRKLTALIKPKRKNSLLRRVIHTQLIELFFHYNEYKYLALFSRNWLTLTDIREMEFYYVADQYAKVNKDKAYDFYSQQAYVKAFNTFYPVIRQTNDAESIFQFLTIGLNEKYGQLNTLQKSLAVLKKQKLLGDNEKYMTALTLLYEAGTNEDKLQKAYDQALVELDSIAQKYNGAMVELLQGYIYHRKLIKTKKVYAYDKSLYQKAHYHYMMALDYARNNGRISATVLQNLGWLHKSVNQFALAVNYLQQRIGYEFISKYNEQSVRWQLANAYYYNNQSSEALNQMQLILKTADQNNLTPFQEKAAFYAMQAGDYEQAISFYEKIFRQTQLSYLNNAKFRLAYAYSLKQIGKNQQAMTQFKQVIAYCDKLSILDKHKYRPVAFNPASLKIIANGFLFQLVKDSQQKIRYLTNRIALLKQVKGQKGISFDEMSRLAFLAKDYQHLALVYEQQKMPSKMLEAMNSSLSMAVAWATEAGDEIGPIKYRTMINYLSLAIVHGDVFQSGFYKELNQVFEVMKKSFDEYPYPTAMVSFQKLKLSILWDIYQEKVMGVKSTLGNLNNDTVAKIKRIIPDKYAELVSLNKLRE